MYAVVISLSIPLKETVASMEEKIREAETYRVEIPNLEARLRSLQSVAKEAEMKTLPDPMPDRVLAVMKAAEEASGARVVSVEEVGYTEERDFGIDRYRVEVEGKYPAVRAFLDALSRWNVQWQLTSFEVKVSEGRLKGQVDVGVPVLRRRLILGLGGEP